MPIAAEKSNIKLEPAVQKTANNSGLSESNDSKAEEKTGIWGLVSDVFTPSTSLKIFKKIGENAAKLPTTTNLITGAAKATVDFVKAPQKFAERIIDSTKKIPEFITSSVDSTLKTLAKANKAVESFVRDNQEYYTQLRQEKHFRRREEERRKLEDAYNQERQEREIQTRTLLEQAASRNREIAKSEKIIEEKKACATPAFIKYLLKKYARFLHGTDVNALTTVDQILRVIRPRISNEEFINIMAQTGRDMSRVFAELEKHGNEHLFGTAIEKALSSGSTLSAEKFAFEIASSVAEENPESHIQPLSSASYQFLV